MAVLMLDEQQIIHVTLAKDFVAEEHMSCINIIAELRHEQNVCKVLIDATDVQTTPTTTQIYYCGEALVSKLVGMRISVIVPTAVCELASFFELVVNNRGGCARVFNCSDKALAWLDLQSYVLRDNLASEMGLNVDARKPLETT